MSTDALSATAPSEALPVDAQDHASDQIECAKQPQPAFLHSPPDSNNAEKSDASDSELSDLEDEPILDDAPAFPTTQHKVEEEEDIGEVLPDHWSGNVPIFKPTMEQFKDFKRFMEKVDSYGMKSGIIKIIPPKEWKDAQPPLDELVKQVRVREPIKQDIMGSNGTYRQVNILHGRSYNIPQWRQLCEQSEHQPPARRGERRANAEKPKPARARPAAPKTSNPSAPKTRGRGRPPKNRGKQKQTEEESRPMTPVSPRIEAQGAGEEIIDSIEKDPGTEVDDLDHRPSVGRMGGIRPAKAKTQSVSARRKYSRREGSAVIDEVAFKDFDYRMDISDYTPERCEELERVYWKTLTYAPPLYGADLMGTLFDDRTEAWNLNKLPNLLDVLGTKVPGVNTAYLYLGMWKATFAWHLEDVDLYSINYLHFGAPKQWYSISQADARRFEAAMKSIWPADAKACDQFLRHKAFLISPQHLLQNYGIKVNKVVSYPGEFVVTYPYGYHSGYNLGYNCAEAVNFALDSWLEMGKIAKKCECAQAQDSVWVNVYEIERKLRGEETEYEETEDDEDDEEDDEPSGLPTPPASHGVKFKDVGRKRKRGPGDRGAKIKVKKIKLRLKVKAEPPCCLCPNDVQGLEILPTDDGRRAHRLCALYMPETYIDMVDGKEVVSNAANIHKDRLELKCLFCRSKRGACFQCSQKKCARAYHATCAAAAGVFTEEQDVPVFGEDGKEYKEQAFEFSCRFHRTKRDRKLDGDALEGDSRVRAAAEALKKGDICQLQYYRGDIFAGMVVENRLDEEMLLVDVLPSGHDRVEVEWKWLLLPDPSDYHLPKASPNAIPLPASRKAKDQLNAKRHDEKPRKDDVFVDGFTWAEFNTLDVVNKEQAKVDLAKEDQIWHYLGKTSTDARAQYTEDPSKPRYNPKGNYLDTIPKPPKPVPAPRPVYRQQSYGVVGPYTHSAAGMGASSTPLGSVKVEKPYVYKPRKPMESNLTIAGMYTPQRFMSTFSASSPSPSVPQQHHYSATTSYQNNALHPVQRFGTAEAYQMSHGQGLPPSAAPPSVTRPIPAAASAQTPSVKAPSSTQTPQHYSKPTWQVHSSVYQKYAFFQVNHNRDSSKYRTPYAPWGGFTNGYQGDLRAHLMANQNDLMRRPSLQSMPPASQLGQTQASPPPGASISLHPKGVASRSPSTPQAPIPGASAMQQKTSMTPSPLPGAPGYQYHPAIKAQYRILAQQGAQAQAIPQQANKPKPAPAPKSYKIPPKQSPVPLPANFLAAMTSSPSTPASSFRPPPLQLAAQQTNSTSTNSTLSPTSRTSPPTAGANQGPAVKPVQQVKISTTPVPLPKFSVQIQQNSAQGITPGTRKPNVPTSSQIKEESPAVDPAINPAVDEPMINETTIVTPEQPADAAHGQAPRSTGASNIPNQSLISIVGTSTAAGPATPINQQTEASTNAQPTGTQSMAEHRPEGFPDVPGCESMEFVERMMENLRRASQRWVVG